jgi:DNA processing protein
MDNRTALIAFTAVESLGPVSLGKLLASFNTPVEIWEADDTTLKEHGVNEQTISALRAVKPEEFTDKQYAAADKIGAKIVLSTDEEYPACLKDLNDAPTTLFIQGEIPSSSSLPGIAIVGTRKPTPYGQKVAAKISAELAEAKVTVVSGYAVGIDAVAHKSAAAAKGVTIAVLGCGLDYDYPVHNKTLRPQIIEKGAVITEFPFGAAPVPWHFPRRNRIVSGLSKAIVVVEAGEKSGALITAKAALDQGRDIFSVPGPIDSPLSIGTNRLIRDGAHPLLQTSDLLLLWARKETKKVPVQIEIPLEENEQTIFTNINFEPCHIDDLAAKCNISISSIMPVLLSLEIKGVVTRHPGMCFSKAG